MRYVRESYQAYTALCDPLALCDWPSMTKGMDSDLVILNWSWNSDLVILSWNEGGKATAGRGQKKA